MFKNIRIIFLCSLFSLSTLAEETDRSMAVSMSPLSLVGGSANALFQYNLTNFLSLTLPVVFSYNWTIPTLINLGRDYGIKTSRAPITIAGGLGARFYPTAKGMTDGFYLEPRFGVSYYQFGAKSGNVGAVEWTQVSIIPKLSLGWDWFYDSGFYINFGGGLGYAYDVKSELKVSKELRGPVKLASRWLPSLIPNPDSKGRVDFELEFKLGYAW